jgi:hypothetical protein
MVNDTRSIWTCVFDVPFLLLSYQPCGSTTPQVASYSRTTIRHWGLLPVE